MLELQSEVFSLPIRESNRCYKYSLIQLQVLIDRNCHSVYSFGYICSKATLVASVGEMSIKPHLGIVDQPNLRIFWRERTNPSTHRRLIWSDERMRLLFNYKMKPFEKKKHPQMWFKDSLCSFSYDLCHIHHVSRIFT